jgi:hypothetical protein
MKKLALLLLILGPILYGQDGKYEKIKALKTAFITEQLNLSPNEAERFWPVYNSFEDQFHELRKRERTEIFKKLREGVDQLTEAEANELIAKNLELASTELELRKEMTAKLRGIISAKKIIILKKTEEDFKRELLDRYRNSKGQKGPKGPK